MVLTTSMEYDCKAHAMNVSTAFLYAGLKNLVYVEQAPDFKVKDKDGGKLVMQLEKNLYRASTSIKASSTIRPAKRVVVFFVSVCGSCVSQLTISVVDIGTEAF